MTRLEEKSEKHAGIVSYPRSVSSWSRRGWGKWPFFLYYFASGHDIENLSQQLESEFSINFQSIFDTKDVGNDSRSHTFCLFWIFDGILLANYMPFADFFVVVDFPFFYLEVRNWNPPSGEKPRARATFSRRAVASSIFFSRRAVVIHYFPIKG